MPAYSPFDPQKWLKPNPFILLYHKSQCLPQSPPRPLKIRWLLLFRDEPEAQRLHLEHFCLFPYLASHHLPCLTSICELIPNRLSSSWGQRRPYFPLQHQLYLPCLTWFWCLVNICANTLGPGMLLEVAHTFLTSWYSVGCWGKTCAFLGCWLVARGTLEGLEKQEDFPLHACPRAGVASLFIFVSSTGRKFYLLNLLWILFKLEICQIFAYVFPFVKHLFVPFVCFPFGVFFLFVLWPLSTLIILILFHAANLYVI